MAHIVRIRIAGILTTTLSYPSIVMTLLCALILTTHFTVSRHVVLPKTLFQVATVGRDGSLTGTMGWRMINEVNKWPLVVKQGKVVSARNKVKGETPVLPWGPSRDDPDADRSVPMSSEMMKFVDFPPQTRRCSLGKGLELVRWGLRMGPEEHVRTFLSVDGKLQPIPGLGKLVACDVVTVGKGWFVVDATEPHQMDSHSVDTGRGNHIFWIEWK